MTDTQTARNGHDHGPDSPRAGGRPRLAAIVGGASTASSDTLPFDGSTDLPAQPTPLLGRERALTAAHTLLARPSVRLVTLIGPGGAGKTRLALALAARVDGELRRGALFVDLSPIEDPDLLLSAIARALRLKESPDYPLLERLQRHLAHTEMLLVLDNMEQIVEGAPRLGEILAACPGIKMLVTSRQALRLRWEHVFPVEPLDVPDPARLPPPAELRLNPSVALFVDRARAVNPTFGLNDANARAIAEICARLDGLPLAIELAAARANVLSPSAMLERLAPSRTLDFLAAGPTDQPARQQTIRAAIDWSHAMLSPIERALFRRLAIFRGGCTIEGATAVSRGWPEASLVDPLSTLAALVDRSLIRLVHSPEGEARFVELEPIREYGLEQLESSGEAAAAADRHLAHYVDLVVRAEPALRGPEQTFWLTRLERELDNLRAALDVAAARGDVEAGLQVAGGLWRFWEVHGHLREGRGRLASLLSRPEPASPAARASALRAAAHLAFLQGDYPAARAQYEEDLALRAGLGDQPGVANATNGLGLIAMCVGDLALARKLFGDAAELNRRLGDRSAEATNLNNLGRVAFYEGDLNQARSLHLTSIDIRRALGDDFGVALATADLADVLVEGGDANRAVDLLAEAAGIWRAQGNRWGIAYVLEGLVGVSVARGRTDTAVTLLACAAAQRESIGEPPSPVRRTTIDRVLRQARPVLSAEEREAAWSAGSAMRPEVALALGLSEPPAIEPPGPVHPPLAHAPVHRPPPTAHVPTPSGPPPGTLSAREREVALLVVRGMTNRQLAEQLVISERTADAHVAKILKKLGFSSRAQIAAWAVSNGLT